MSLSSKSLHEIFGMWKKLKMNNSLKHTSIPKFL